MPIALSRAILLGSGEAMNRYCSLPTVIITSERLMLEPRLVLMERVASGLGYCRHGQQRVLQKLPTGLWIPTRSISVRPRIRGLPTTRRTPTRTHSSLVAQRRELCLTPRRISGCNSGATRVRSVGLQVSTTSVNLTFAVNGNPEFPRYGN